MNVELLDLKSFVTVADLGSFVRAAELLNLSQPALSRRIRRLEETLGARLFERTTRHVALTAVGRDFLPKARRLVEEFESSVLAIRDLGRRTSGLVTVAAVPSVAFRFLPKTVARFSEAYPRIRIRILDIGANEGLEAVARGEADFGINYIGAADAAFDFTALLEDPFVLACRHDHRLAARQRVRWDELDGERLIVIGQTSSNRRLIDNALGQRGMRLDWTYEVMHLSGMLGLVEAGLGIAVLPSVAAPPAAQSIIHTVDIVAPRVSRTIGIVQRHDPPVSPVAGRLLAMLLEDWQAPRSTG
ncbi:LysR family transcriptional regulator [Telmatospirillum siberiense]|uniref:LysR family transcriptional regulator n=1 Tax=Telmatospirillum siberiense TaxID=382514 RepID=A0A2N3PRN1_9PROT|nr:LysR family transcriptional regulator [Telmatospirillum siberiense]PKU23056.1 LysR family transcriptional regulator [Telmatospirillum siberiense]